MPQSGYIFQVKEINYIMSLTIFTPTFNRGKLLINCYKSLKRQSRKDFKWLIIDDGSIDDTEEIVNRWIDEENSFSIKYYKKENEGLYSAYNFAIPLIDTELFMCVDSDDYLTDNAVDLILDEWNRRESKMASGLIGLNLKNNIKIIGKFPDLDEIHLSTLITKYNFRQDFKAVYKTSIAKKYLPMPTFGNEKDLNPIYLMLKIDRDYNMLIFNQPICVVNYQKDGMSSNILEQYIKSPNSFAELRRVYLSLNEASMKFKIRHSIHYVSSSILSRNIIRNFLNTPCPVYYILSFLPGLVLTLFIWICHKNKELFNKK